MKKYISALAVILLILAATACTQYQYNWEDFLPGGKAKLAGYKLSALSTYLPQ